MTRLPHSPAADAQLLRLHTPVYPTPAQAARLQDWQRQVADMQRAARAGQLPLDRGLPALTRAILAARPAGRDEPAALWRGVASQLLRSVASRPPTPDPATLRLPLDLGVQAVGDLHVHLSGWETLLLADLWRLPLGLSAALVGSGERHRQQLQARLAAARAADRAMDPRALVALHRLGRTHAPLLTLPAGPPPAPAVVRRPERATHATLVPVTADDGQAGWAIGWSLRVPPGWLPRATRHDTAGVDPGVRQLVTWADATRHGHLPHRGLPTGDWRPHPGHGGPHPLADALVRRAQFERLSPALDRMLRHLLGYDALAVEATRWSGLRALGRTSSVEAMARTGLTSLLPWLEALGPLTGTRVQRVSPWHSSHRCGHCGRPGQRDAQHFECAVCGREDADVSAARYLRRRALRGEA
jgi:Putative transposase DNA-binding domain